MSLDTTIFKAYDIRGIYPTQINGQIAYQIGFALASYLKPKTIAVGRDMRLSSDELAENFMRGLTDYGVDVIDLGLCSTDGLYFAVGKYEYDGGVMITASHNPKEYNGFKICREKAIPLSGSEGLSDILKMLLSGKMNGKASEKGNIIRKDIADEYAKHCLSFIDLSKIKTFKIAIDTGN